jgi:transglutaminase-like putative cysteine protease
VLQAKAPGKQAVRTGAAILDYSNVKDGYLCVKSNLGATQVKVLVTINGSQYQYTVGPSGYTTIPLTCGPGSYQVGVWKNISGTMFAGLLSKTLQVNNIDGFKPFLYPSQYVPFVSGDESTQLSQSLTTGAGTDVQALNDIYDYVVQNISYDTAKAETVQSGYLPDNTQTLASKSGICFDYAALTASMLRAQGIPTKEVVGYAQSAYHAWIQVYCQDTGKVLSYQFDGHQWQRMDPTFDAATKGAMDISGLVGDGDHYQPLFYY